jgi:hypothetical protein
MRREKKRKKKEKDLRGTPKLQLQHHWYYKKDLDETNLTTTKNVTNGDQVGHTCHQRQVSHSPSLDD